MADFCKQCTKYYFGPNVKNDFEGIQSPETTELGFYSEVICEGCGLIIVDHNGKCVSLDCEKHGRKEKLNGNEGTNKSKLGKAARKA